GGVWHAADRGKSAGGGRPRSGFDGLGVLNSGLAKMHVHVDETRGHNQTGRIKHLGARVIEPRAPCYNASLLDSEIGHGVESRRRIEDASIPNSQFAHR